MKGIKVIQFSLISLVFICHFGFTGEKNLLEVSEKVDKKGSSKRMQGDVLLENKSVERIKGHLLLQDFSSAMEEGALFIAQFPFSDELRKLYIKALAFNGREAEAIGLVKKYFDNKVDIKLLEDVAWGILESGTKSSQYSVKITSLIGAYLTRDVHAVRIILEMMRDSNAIIRMVAVKFSSEFQDEILKREISLMLRKEKLWLVRLEVIKTAGLMKLSKDTSFLSDIASSGETTYDEKAAAVEALINIYDDINELELRRLFHSPKGGLREFACRAAQHFEMKKMEGELLELTTDSMNDVKIEALHGLVFLNSVNDKVKEALKKCEEDINAKVAITASWAMLVLYGEGINLEKWLFDNDEDNRRFAAAAIASSGKSGIKLAMEGLNKSKDEFVKLNLALGLIGQRKDVKRCQDILHNGIREKKQMWMWDYSNKFSMLTVSQIRHMDQIPNYPEAVDQMTELQVISLLSITEDSRAASLLKTFIKEKRWGISGVAAVTLLQEGDEDSLRAIKGLLTDEDINVRTQAALVLALYGKDDSVVSVLEGAYMNADRELKLHILEALGFVHASASFKFFLNVLDEPFEVLRIAGASSLIQTLNK
jgi:HEAT repeat protein